LKIKVNGISNKIHEEETYDNTKSKNLEGNLKILNDTTKIDSKLNE